MVERKSSLTSNLGRARTATPRSSSETIAHPLLGASPAATSAANADDSSDKESIISMPPVSRSPELPYKPRQRQVSTAPSDTVPVSAPPVTSTSTVSAPTSTSTTFASPTNSSHSTMFSPPQDEPATATATSRLQLQALKAAAQRIGLGNGSQGMAMIDAIFDKGARVRSEAGDWADVLKMLTSGKAVILLPSSPASSLPMTPQTLRDHIALFAPPISVDSSTANVLVTLSGLIGTLRGTTVAFESTVPSDSPLIAALREDARRVGVLGSLRPTQIDSATSFPSYTLSEESTSLSFPPLGKAVPLPLEKKEKESVRRMNPFMSLFGSSAAATPSPSLRGALSPERPASPSPAGGSGVSSPRPSIVSLERVDSNASDVIEGYAVTAYTISKPVRFTEVHKALVKAVRSTVRADLEGLPDKIADKVLRFVVSSVCPVSGGSVDPALLKSHHHGLGPSDNDGVPLDFSDPTTCGERLQDFMEAVYDDLVRYHREGSPNSRKPRKSTDGEETADSMSERIEKEAGEGTERVEALICRLLYNRIFSPLQSDDARHDEALSSRIAALNLLDLSLDHLGLITRPPDEPEKGAIARGLAELVENIGQELQKLSASSCLTPKDKADILVSAHKLAADGLSKLQPIELRPEGEPYIPEREEALSPIVEQTESERRTSPVPNLVLSDSAAADPTSPDDDDAKSTDDKAREPPRPTPATSGADLILPLIIYAVVKGNPPQLASQLMYLQRYRSAICLEGEASYAIVNLTAVVEFIEHVQLSELGLGDGSQVMSVEDLSPIRVTYDDSAETASIVSASSRLRGRVFQVGELAGSAAGSANKVITGVVDSLSTLRGYISSAEEKPTTTTTTATRPRGASAFSLASVTASVANMAAAATAARTRSRASSTGDGDRELVEVASRPGSIRPSTYSDGEESDESPPHDARSIRSVSSMMRESSGSGRLGLGFKNEKEKGFFGFSRPSRRSSLGLGRGEGGGTTAGTGTGTPGTTATTTTTTPASAPPASISVSGIEPIERFMTCEVGDIRLSEVGLLLRDYRRLAAVLARLQE